MPPRSAVEQLPPELRNQLDERLMQAGFSGYSALAEWLREQGCEISRSAVQRYGSAFEERCQAVRLATEQARALCATAPDDEGVLSEAIVRTMQERIYTFVQTVKLDPETTKIGPLLQSVAQLSRAQVDLKKYQSTVRERATALADSVAAELAKPSEAGWTQDRIRAIRTSIIGLAK